MDTIKTTHSKFTDKVQSVPLVQKQGIRSKMNVFDYTTKDESKKLFLSSSSKSCDLDPIPTSVLKHCLGILITPITDIITISVETSTAPQDSPSLKTHKTRLQMRTTGRRLRVT